MYNWYNCKNPDRSPRSAIISTVVRSNWKLYVETYNSFIEALELKTTERILSSGHFPQYKFIANSPSPDNIYLNSAIPWILKKFIVQLRVNPNLIEMPTGITLLTPSQPCSLCTLELETWFHLLKCQNIRLHVMSPRNFIMPTSPEDFFSTTIPNLTIPTSWYLFKIAKLISSENDLEPNTLLSP